MSGYLLSVTSGNACLSFFMKSQMNAILLGFRLNFTRDPTTNTIAGATLRQLTPVVMERVMTLANDTVSLIIHSFHYQFDVI